MYPAPTSPSLPSAFMEAERPAPERGGAAAVNGFGTGGVLVASMYERNSALRQDPSLTPSSGRSRAARRCRRLRAHRQDRVGEPGGAGASAGRQGLGRIGGQHDQGGEPQPPGGRQPDRGGGRGAPQTPPPPGAGPSR